MNLNDFAAQLISDGNLELPQMALFYGAPLSGKTSLVAQFARRYKVIWIDCDNKYNSIFTALPQEFWGNVDLIVIKDDPQYPRAIETSMKLLRSKNPVRVCNAHGTVDCIACIKSKAGMSTYNFSTLDTNTIVVLDSLTAISASAFAKSSNWKDDFHFEYKEFDNYNKQTLWLNTLFAGAKQLPCHFVAISHEAEREHEDSSSLLTPTCGTKGYSTSIASKFHHVLHCKIYNLKHVVNSVSTKEPNAITGSVNRVEVKDTESLLTLFKVKVTELGKANLQFGDPANATTPTTPIPPTTRE